MYMFLEHGTLPRDTINRPLDEKMFMHACLEIKGEETKRQREEQELRMAAARARSASRRR
jgi:hypothetical protein